MLLSRGRNFFDLCRNRLAGLRVVKRWLLEQDPFFQGVVELPEERHSARAGDEFFERLRCQLADRPGIESDVSREAALEFAHSHKPLRKEPAQLFLEFAAGQ
ncbi:MAG: hypothetical protein WAM39_12205 [Bryobacteraceae bacterium]